MGFPIGDLGGGYAAAVGILSALWARERTGQPQRVDISMLDVQITLQGHLGQFYLFSGQVPGPIGSSHPTNIPIGAYRCADGTYIQIHCATQKFYENLARVIGENVEGLEGLPQDPRFATPGERLKHRQELEAILREAFATKSAREWLGLLEAGDVPVAPVNTIDRALEEPQVQLRHMVVELEHPQVGRYRSAGNPIKMGQEEFRPAPTLGQHTEEVLRDLLGYTDERILALRKAGVI
jgi:crotonobetainyl-CoA:carnitine CoA-transferase CaiB-like acyl-CoA transferase